MIPDACPTPNDFLAPAHVLTAPLRPGNCARIRQTPSEFTWPEIASPPAQSGPGEKPKRYATLTLKFPDGHAESVSTDSNWLAWDSVLPPGEYRWQLTRPDGAKSAERRFTIEKDAAPFVIPGNADALKHAKAQPRPRTWTHDDRGAMAAIKAERKAGFGLLLRMVEDKVGVPVQPEPRSGSINANYDDTVGEQKRSLAAALAWAATKNRRYGEDAARRLVAQAKWSVDGPLSFRENDMGSRTVAWTLALGYDWMHDYLDAEQKRVIREAIRARTEAMYREKIAGGELWRQPYDSHGNLTLTITAAIAALMAGEIPEADEWFRGSVRAAAVWTSPWGGGDGGFANGTIQGQWDTGSNLLAWYVLESAAGVPILQKEWVREHARYLAYFVPPGAPGNVFGDGQEIRADDTRALVAKALDSFSPTSLGHWYASRLQGENPAAIELLVAPRRKSAPGSHASAFVRVSTNPAGGDNAIPNAAFFPSIGWVAMHSDLADPRRTSVYFKSSPYGSFNHSHADQNAFVIDQAGERLAIATGYYDGYKTAHWREWYKQTRSANAVTFDGGQGQGVEGMEFSGKITAFESDGRIDRATGEAQAAYAGALTRAERTITYDRATNTVTVHDRLSSATPRTWEWNLHAAKRMEPASERRVSVRNGQARMCVEVQKSPAAEFTQTDAWTAPPSGQGDKQWHGRFSTREKSREAEFLVVMRIGKEC